MTHSFPDSRLFRNSRIVHIVISSVSERSCISGYFKHKISRLRLEMTIVTQSLRERSG
jgi:hypothetical protein